MSLTDTQAKILNYMAEHQEARHAPPTIREIGGRFGITSPNGVMCHVRALVKKGYVSQGEAGTARRFVVVRLPNGHRVGDERDRHLDLLARCHAALAIASPHDPHLPGAVAIALQDAGREVSP